MQAGDPGGLHLEVNHKIFRFGGTADLDFSLPFNIRLLAGGEFFYEGLRDSNQTCAQLLADTRGLQPTFVDIGRAVRDEELDQLDRRGVAESDEGKPPPSVQGRQRNRPEQAEREEQAQVPEQVAHPEGRSEVVKVDAQGAEWDEVVRHYLPGERVGRLKGEPQAAEQPDRKDESRRTRIGTTIARLGGCPSGESQAGLIGRSNVLVR